MPESSHPTPITQVIAGLLDTLAGAGRTVPRPPSPSLTFEDGARALFSIAGQTGASVFSVWAEEEEDGQVASGISLFFAIPDEPGTEGLLGSEREAVRVRLPQELYRPLGEALATIAKRGADANRPSRGSVSYPADATDPDTVFRVTFADGALGTWVTAFARDRRTRAAFPSFSDLPLSAADAAFLEELFFDLGALFRGQWVLFTGERGSGRTTSLHAAMEALADNVRGFAALEEPRALDNRVGIVRPIASEGMAAMVRAFMRQDPDVVLVDEVRTAEDLLLLRNAALTGHATAAVFEAKTPEDALTRLRELQPELFHPPLLVHHTRDADSGARTITVHRPPV